MFMWHPGLRPVALVAVLIGLSILATVGALPPPTNLPIPISQYGVVAVYSNEGAEPSLGTVNIRVAVMVSGYSS